MAKDPSYVNPDDPWGEGIVRGRPKWQSPNPKRPLEKKMLDAVGRQYYHSHEERTLVVNIAKTAMPLNDAGGGAYPVEWIAFCCGQAIYNRKHRIPVGLDWLIRRIMDKERQKIWRETRPELHAREEKRKPKLFRAEEDE